MIDSPVLLVQHCGCPILVKNHKSIIIDVERPLYGGYYIGRYRGKTVMLHGAALPEERVSVMIEKEKRDYLVASISSIIHPSPYRIEPSCPYFGACGGCQLQHAPYDLQVKLKEDILVDTLRRLAKLDIELSASLLSVEPWHYRARAQFKIASGRVGFYRGGSTDLVEIDHCPLMYNGINKVLAKAKPFLQMVPAGELHISHGDETIAYVKLTGGNPISSNRLASACMDAGFSGLIMQWNDREMLRYGRPYITLDLLDMKYSVSAVSFFQSNWALNQRLVAIIKDTLGDVDKRRVLDLYAGAGNISLPLSGSAAVTAVEENPQAVECGVRNVEINRIGNYRFVTSPAEAFQAEGMYDILILDPPRSGLTKKVMKYVTTSRAEQIIYISCNPATFARDLNKLTTKYDIKSVRMVDFFPQTFHIEVLAFLGLR